MHRIEDMEEEDITSHAKKESKRGLPYILTLIIFVSLGVWLTTSTRLLEVASESLDRKSTRLNSSHT